MSNRKKSTIEGKCEVCGKWAPLKRTYWNYAIKCECCYPSHFELITHCFDCIPTEPTKTNIRFRTETLKKGRLTHEQHIQEYATQQLQLGGVKENNPPLRDTNTYIENGKKISKQLKPEFPQDRITKHQEG